MPSENVERKYNLPTKKVISKKNNQLRLIGFKESVSHCTINMYVKINKQYIYNLLYINPIESKSGMAATDVQS